MQKEIAAIHAVDEELAKCAEMAHDLQQAVAQVGVQAVHKQTPEIIQIKLSAAAIAETVQQTLDNARQAHAALQRLYREGSD